MKLVSVKLTIVLFSFILQNVTKAALATTKATPVFDSHFNFPVKTKNATLVSDGANRVALLKKLDSHDEQIQNLNALVETLSEQLKSNQEEFSEFRNSINANISTLNEELRNAEDAIAQLNSRVEAAESKANESYSAFQNCLTDVRFSTIDNVGIWKGPGFSDTVDYVITGVDNFNQDEYADHVQRRRFEVQRGSGAWKGAIWS